jgi:hypothetical protein
LFLSHFLCFCYKGECKLIVWNWNFVLFYILDQISHLLGHNENALSKITFLWDKIKCIKKASFCHLRVNLTQLVNLYFNIMKRVTFCDLLSTKNFNGRTSMFY